MANTSNEILGILWCNLGTPTAPTRSAVRRYLREFLSDSRVVTLPRSLWLPILYGCVLPFRPGKAAVKYRSIWTEQGSPLAVYTRLQAEKLQQTYAEKNRHPADHEKTCHVFHAMRYGQPSIAQGLDALMAKGAQRILVLPAYPQYSASTTGSLWDAVAAWGSRQRVLPHLHFVRSYHDDPLYIHALAQRVRSYWARYGTSPQLLMSFHGLPQRQVDQGDPYELQCRETGRLLAQTLGLSAQSYRLSFQSRFGAARWLEPSTENTLIEMARAGASHVQVVCPGFTADCLETLEEIAQEGQETFLKHGGKRLDYIPALNDDPVWIQALHGLIERQSCAGRLSPC
jgi:ferrochelatase